MQDAHAGELNPVSSRSHTHKRLLLRSYNYIANDQRIPILDEFLNRHLRIRKHFPESVVELLYTFQSWFNSLISMQNDVIGIEMEIVLPLTRVSEALERALQALPVGHEPILRVQRRD